MRILFIKATTRSESQWQQVFHRSGHHVDSFTDLLSGERALAVIPYCAVLIEMPPQDTRVIQMVSRWRNKGLKTPVMVLSHERLVTRRVAVINAGADDCVELPPDPEELEARMRAIVRRGYAVTSPRLQCGGIVFDTITREIFVDGKPVRLTARETALLEIFMLNGRRTLSKNYLVEKMYSWQKSISSNVVEVFVSGLPKKTGQTGHPDCLRSGVHVNWLFRKGGRARKITNPRKASLCGQIYCTDSLYVIRKCHIPLCQSESHFRAPGINVAILVLVL